MMSYIKLIIVVPLLVAATYVAAKQVTNARHASCQKYQSPEELVTALRLAIGSSNSDQLACLFHHGVIDIEFDKTHWLTRSKKFEKQYPELLNSGFAELIRHSDEANSSIEDKNHVATIENRMKIKYGNWEGAIGYKIINIRDILYPTHFPNFHSEANLGKWFTKLQLAVMNGDKASVASLACYPLAVRQYSADNNYRSIVLNRESEFVSRYNEVITPHTKSIVAAAMWPHLWQNSEGIMLGQGDLWIYPKESGQCIGLIDNGPGIEKLDEQAGATK